MPRTSTASSSPPDPAPPPGVPHRPREIESRLSELGIVPSRRLGQSFLTDPFVADAEAALLEVPAGAAVTEIGGGLGILTEALLRRGIGPLTVIERDRRLAAHLREVFGARITLKVGDALELPLPPAEAVVGNLPFSVATPLLTRLFEARVPRIVVLLQKEVGERYTAGPRTHGYGRPAIQAALYGRAERFAPVPASAFSPVPAVAGVLVRFTGREGPLPVRSPLRLERTVRDLFGRRRKQLGNLLPAVAGGSERARRLAEQAGWPSEWARMRPEELGPEAYFALADALETGPTVDPPRSDGPGTDRPGAPPP